MGESGEGEGRGHEVTSTEIIRSLVKAYHDEGREVSELVFMRLSTGLYSLHVRIHGETEPEEVQYFEDIPPLEGRTSPPYGGYKATEGVK